jgi:bacteriorhodopsin
MGNQALAVNPPGFSEFSLTTNGSNWLWSVFSLMSLAAIIIALLSMRRHPRERTLYLFNISVLTTASIAYFCMASDLGYAPIQVLQRGPGYRQFWYVRYIDWVITTPLLLTELLLIAGLPINIILSSIFADLVMIICGLIGGLVPSVYKWAFYVFGCVAMFWVFWNILSGIKSSEKTGGTKNRQIYIILTIWLLFFWTIYPIAWGLCEGSNVISVTGEMIFYGILDIFTKPFFAALMLFLHRNMNIKENYHEKEIRIERSNYPPPPQQQQEIEFINTGYVMPSPNLIRSKY